jgi:hypothetical protein
MMTAGRRAYVFRMSDQVSSPPPDHEPEAQPAAGEAPADHLADDSKAEAGETEPATPKPSRKQRGRPESRFSVLTALISAAAALIGAGVGGFASYYVAQANNSAQSNQALITRRQTAYSDFISAETDLENAEYRLHDAISDFEPPNIEPVKAAFKQENDTHTKWNHEAGTVQMVDSTGVDQALDAIIIRQADLSKSIQNFVNQVEYQMTTVDGPALDKFVADLKGLEPLDHQFITAAKSDIER